MTTRRCTKIGDGFNHAYSSVIEERDSDLALGPDQLIKLCPRI